MVRNLMARRHKPELLTQLDEAHRLDARLRDITSERDATRAQVNDISKQVGALRKAGDTAAAEAAIGLAILVVLFRERRSINVEDLDTMKG